MSELEAIADRINTKSQNRIAERDTERSDDLRRRHDMAMGFVQKKIEEQAVAGAIKENYDKLRELEDKVVADPPADIVGEPPSVDSEQIQIEDMSYVTLYQVRAVREFDEDGELIAAGSETGTTVATIDAGHTLRWTYSWVRAHA